MAGNSAGNSRLATRPGVWLLGAYWLLHVTLFHWPVESLPHHPIGTDKLVHFGGYFLLAVLAALAARPWLQSADGYQGRWIILLAALAVYGIVDELTQPLTGRSFEWFDWAVDLLGISIGLATTAFFLRRRDAST